MRINRWMACWIIAAILVPPAAIAQRVAVITNSLSATRQAAALYAHDITWDPAGARVSPPIRLPGVALSAPLMPHPSEPLAVVSTRYVPTFGAFTDFSACFIPLLETSSLRHVPEALLRGNAMEILHAACIVVPPGGSPLVAVLASGIGKDEVRLYRPGAGRAPTAAFALPAPPLLAFALPQGRLAVLCATPDGTAVLYVLDAASGKVLIASQELPLPAQIPQEQPPAAVATDGETAIIALSGHSFESPSGTPETRLLMLDTATLEVRHWLQAPGLVASGGLTLRDGVFWLATHTPSDRFAHVGSYRVTEGKLRREEQYSFAEAADPPVVSLAPGAAAVAVAVGRNLELWRDGRPGSPPRVMQDTVRALHWAQDALLVAEGSRVHRLTLDGEPTGMAQLQSGVVVDLLVLPDARPGAQRPAPTIELPHIRLFSGAAIGRELQAVLVSGSNGASDWRVVTEALPPWLLVQPPSGTLLPDFLYLSTNPVRYGDPTVARSGIVPVEAIAPSGGIPIARDELVVHVRPTATELQRILWVWETPLDKSVRDASDPRGFRPLAEALASPPHLFVQEETTVPVIAPLRRYAVVILTARAAAAGAVTRQMALDFVVNGGALLLLGEHLPEAARSLTQWLSPLGITIDAERPVSGTFAQHGGSPLSRHWEDFAVSGGALLRTQRTQDVTVPGPEPDKGDAVLFAREYGHGRVAVLAAPTPLETTAMSRTANRRFVDDLFRWLARAGSTINDLDQDGLPDHVEDANGNGLRDPGETDMLLPDTDGDGIPDGMEDANWNGRQDIGETSPLLPDSDNDGILDGADRSPVPPPGAPILVAVEPSAGPAEGGSRVALSGENLSSGVQVWFGDRVARMLPEVLGRGTTVLVETPASPGFAPGSVDVRVVNTDEDLETRLDGAFTYEPRTTVTMRAAVMDRVRAASGMYSGIATVDVTFPPTARVALIELTLQPEPGGSILWRRATATPSGTADIAVLQSPRAELPLLLRNLERVNGAVRLRVEWEQVDGGVDSPVSVALTGLRAMAANGVELEVVAVPERVYLSGSPPPARRAGSD